jgi:CTP synthase (UTP-ammonia lyase)
MYVETNWAHKVCGFANYYVQKFAAINGILFPGGATSLKGGPFYQTSEKLFNMVIEANERGDYFPLYGVCLGFELLTVLVSQVHSLILAQELLSSALNLLPA